jgi:uncharacterized membrane-anchored protein YjiN (DUF445 family)
MGLLFDRAKTGFLNPVNKTVDGLISASNGLMCLKNAIMGAFMSPASILSGLGLAAASMANAIIESVTSVITKRANQIVNSLLSPIRQIEQLITDITKTLIDTQNLLDRASNMDNYFKDKQNCSTMAADLLNCLAQSAINKISNKVAMNVDKHIGSIADSVSKKAFKADGILAGKIDRHTKFIEKAQLQNKLLT